MLVIRLSRTGKINQAQYRLVAADKRRAVKGKYLEILGFYNPLAKPKEFSANKEKILNYLKRGAQLSDTVNNLLCDHGVLPKNQKRKIVYARKKVEKEEVTEAKTTEKDQQPVEDVKPEVANDQKIDETPVEAEASEHEVASKPSPEQPAVDPTSESTN